MNCEHHTISAGEKELTKNGFELSSEYGWTRVTDQNVRQVATIKRSQLTGLYHIHVVTPSKVEFAMPTYLMSRDVRGHKRRATAKAVKLVRELTELMQELKTVSEEIQADLTLAVARGELTIRQAKTEMNKLVPLINYDRSLTAPLLEHLQIMVNFSEELP